MSYLLRSDVFGGEMIVRLADGAAIPHDERNRDYAAYQAWRDAGNTPEAETPPGPTADDVRAEASRRMQGLVGARDAGHLEIIVSNANREAIRLLRKGEPNWSEAERVRAAQLEEVDQQLEIIRAASNALEAADPVPGDYADDRHWAAGAPE